MQRPRRPHLQLWTDSVPAVDVLITCCGEDHETILNTVQAACATDYPKERLQIFLLDDAASADLAKAMSILQLHKPNLFYSARKKGPIRDYKAGNLNHGLKCSAALSDCPAPFVAGLDADMIVEPHWLSTLLPHLLNDPGLALACPPQVGHGSLIAQLPH